MNATCFVAKHSKFDRPYSNYTAISKKVVVENGERRSLEKKDQKELRLRYLRYKISEVALTLRENEYTNYERVIDFFRSKDVPRFLL